jgi:hypothetical protein
MCKCPMCDKADIDCCEDTCGSKECIEAYDRYIKARILLFVKHSDERDKLIETFKIKNKMEMIK